MPALITSCVGKVWPTDYTSTTDAKPRQRVSIRMVEARRVDLGSNEGRHRVVFSNPLDELQVASAPEVAPETVASQHSRDHPVFHSARDMFRIAAGARFGVIYTTHSPKRDAREPMATGHRSSSGWLTKRLSWPSEERAFV